MKPVRLSLFVAALALGLPLAAAPASAEDLPPTSEFFDEYDKNADGCVTSDEFRGSGEIFKLLDKNGDGSIKPDELGLPADFKPDPKRRRKAPGAEAGADRGQAGQRLRRTIERLNAMDTDKDSRVSEAEWKGDPKGFARMDRNKDGYVDRKDMKAMSDRGGKRGKNKGQKKPSLTDEMKERISTRAAQQFKQMDKNADGRVTAEEAPFPMLIELADGDGDGEVDLKELKKVLLQRATRQAQAGGGKADRRRPRRGRVNPGMLNRWDADKDGKVSSDEFPGRDQMFKNLDKDGDGYLTEADLKKAANDDGAAKTKKAPVTSHGGSVIDQMDTDRDGRLHRAEFRGSAEDWARLDRNRDGWITPDELTADPSK